MGTTRGHRLLFTAATVVLFSLASALSHAGDGKGDKGQDEGWYDKDKDKDRGEDKYPGPKTTVLVPEPGTMVLLITGLAAVALGLGTRRRKS